VASFAHPLKEPTRNTFFAPGASTVNRTTPAMDCGMPGFNTGELTQDQKALVSRIVTMPARQRRLSPFSLISMRERVLEDHAAFKRSAMNIKY
jgi:hypothetical protein